MRTKLTVFAALFLLFTLLLTSCGGSEDGGSGDSAPSAEASETPSADSAEASAEQSSEQSTDRPAHPSDIADYSVYITLGEYKGVKLQKKTVTDELLEEKRRELLDSVKEQRDVGKERAAALGDIAVFDYKGFRTDTGEAFEGGEASDAKLVLGSGRFIPGFEEGIVGHRAGESFDVNVKFPEDYREKSLAGQNARFDIKLKAVQETVYPEVTDELAKKLKYDGAEALLSEVRRLAEEQVYGENLRGAWLKAVDNAEIKSYPQELFKSTVGDYAVYYFSYYSRAAAQYGVELEEYVGMPVDEFRKELEKQGEKYATSYLAEVMTVYAIADAEFGREISDDEYREKAEEYAKKEGISAEQLSEKYDREKLLFNMLWDKALAFVYENAEFTE